MKRITTVFVLLFAFAAYGQDKQSSRDKIESARIALISERLGLSPDQAERFWPLYREFREQTEGLRQEYADAKSQLNKTTSTDKEKRDLLQLGLRLKERKVELEKQYSERMLTIISAEQLMSLRTAEEDFRRMLLEQLQKRRLQQDQRNQIREKIRERKNADDG